MKKNCCLLFSDEITSARVISYFIKNDLNISLILISKKKNLKNYFKNLKISALYLDSFNNKKILYFLKKKKVNFLIININNILKKNFFANFNGKIYAVHNGFLPKYKGRDMTDWMYAYGLKNFGCTLFYVNPDIDSGKIITVKKFKPKLPISFQKLKHEIHYKTRLPLYSLIPLIINKKKTFKLKSNKNKFIFSPMHKKIKSILMNSVLAISKK